MTIHNNTRSITVTAALMLALSLWGSPITESQAKSTATHFMAGKSLYRVALQHANKAPGQSQAAYYVFNAEANDGYVIVSGDDRLPAILGYSDTGRFDADDIPPAMQELLDYYAEQAFNPSAQTPHQVSRTPIAPLLTCNWAQSLPFNHYLPTFTNSDGTSTTAPTGCVATAMAQVMYYHHWPTEATTAIPAYTSSYQSIYRPELPSTTFSWGLMNDYYYNSSAESDADYAVAKLLEYCGQAVQMNYKKNASSAASSHIPEVMYNYFHYDGSIQHISRINYCNSEWENLLYSELQTKRPVIYHGRSEGGHAFVCDGCDASGRFHINWGWGGNENGYFVLSDLTTYGDTFGYIFDQGMVTGIKPLSDSSTSPYYPFIKYYDMDYQSETSLTRSSSNDNFTVTITGKFYNSTLENKNIDFGWGLFQGNTLLNTVSIRSNKWLQPNYYTYPPFDLNFGAGLSNGTYELRPIFSNHDANDWLVCDGGTVNYVQIDINSNLCTVTIRGERATPSYTASELTFAGTMHTGKQVDVTATLTNTGNTLGDAIYLFVDNVKTTMGLADIPKSTTGSVLFHFTPTTAGNKTVKLSLNEDGNDPLIQRTLQITAMPEASLTATHTVLNVTDDINNIVTGNTFSITSTIKNTGTTAYNDEVVAFLTNGYNQTTMQRLYVPLQLAAGETKTVRFDCDNVMNGMKYYVTVRYYSGDKKLKCGASTPKYTINFPTQHDHNTGDANGDGMVDIADVNVVINIMLGKAQQNLVADVTGDGQVDIADVNAIINIMLGK